MKKSSKNVSSEKALINRGDAFLLRRNLAARDAVIKLVIIFLKIVFFDMAPSRRSSTKNFFVCPGSLELGDLPPSL